MRVLLATRPARSQQLRRAALTGRRRNAPIRHAAGHPRQVFGDARCRGDRPVSRGWPPNGGTRRGKFRALHRIGPARLDFLRDEMLRHFARGQAGMRPLDGLRVLDVGCGGGLICEPLARLGARVTGLDPAAENIEAARRHAAGQGLDIDYRAGRVEELEAEGRLRRRGLPGGGGARARRRRVPEACAALVRPGGLMLLSTLNRTIKAYLLAIIGGEYVLRWLPVGTHQWDRFVTPDELARHLSGGGSRARRASRGSSTTRWPTPGRSAPTRT